MIFSMQNDPIDSPQDVVKEIEDRVDVSSYLIGYENIKPKDAVNYDKEESDLVANVVNERLSISFAKYGYTEIKLKTIFQGCRCSSTEKMNLNYAIKMVRKFDVVPVKDIIIFFMLFASVDKVLQFIDTELVLCAKKELADDHGLKMSRSERRQCTTQLF